MIAENKSNPLERLKIIALKRYKSEAHFRMPKPDRKRKQSNHPPVGLIIPDLSDRSIFPKIHQWRTDPLMFSIHSHIDIRPADTFRLNGVTYKVKSCEEYRIDRQLRSERKLGDDVRYFEVKMMVWGRCQG